jgi:DNA polymerase-3 subunit epsilon
MITPEPAGTALNAAAATPSLTPATGPAATRAPGRASPDAAAGRAGPFGRTDFVVVDVETTGWEPEAARITEIAAVRVSGGRVRQVFSSLVNPGCPVPEPVAALTGITDALVAGAPAIADVLPGFLAFAGGAVLTAHNAPFDVGFISAACQACGLAWPGFTVLDTVAIARVMLSPGEVPDCKLATLASYFGTAVPPRHRALADALATADVLECLLGRLAAAGTRTVTEVSALIEREAAAAAEAWADAAATGSAAAEGDAAAGDTPASTGGAATGDGG